jgi:hypothetical protein
MTGPHRPKAQAAGIASTRITRKRVTTRTQPPGTLAPASTTDDERARHWPSRKSMTVGEPL